VLVAAAVTTGILGVLPAFRLAWIFTGLAGIAALALAGLIAYARELEEQRQQFRSRGGDQRAMAVEDDRTVVVSRAAQSGLPGAWDEDQYGDEYGGIEGSESLPQRRTATGG
jgi:membrane protein implicated in regulation of membrane protease activity